MGTGRALHGVPTRPPEHALDRFPLRWTVGGRFVTRRDPGAPRRVAAAGRVTAVGCPGEPAVRASGNCSRACLQSPVVTGALWLAINHGHKTSRDGQALQTQPSPGAAGLRLRGHRRRPPGRVVHCQVPVPCWRSKRGGAAPGPRSAVRCEIPGRCRRARAREVTAAAAGARPLASRPFRPSCGRPLPAGRSRPEPGGESRAAAEPAGESRSAPRLPSAWPDRRAAAIPSVPGCLPVHSSRAAWPASRCGDPSRPRSPAGPSGGA